MYERKNKEKIWSTKKADDEFRKWIYRRDGRCIFCGRKPPAVVLTCSHFWGRFTSATRFDPDNCDALCQRDHFNVENAKQGKYRDFKIKQLGLKRYNALEKKYYQKKTTRREEIIKLMKWLGKNE